MKIYHQLGHNHKWALDAHFQNAIGDGFIFSAYSFDYAKFGGTVSSYKPEEYLPKSMIDLQFYGSRDNIGGKLDTYPFNPTNLQDNDSTMVDGTSFIIKGIKFQIASGLKDIIIPIFYEDSSDLKKLSEYIKSINKKIKKNKEKGKFDDLRFWMTVPLSNAQILDDNYVEALLLELTDMAIAYDGYYVVCDAKPEYKKKISVDYNYYENLLKIFSVLKSQGFMTCHGYANWDSLVLNALCDIDIVTIGTYENLRNFNISRFVENKGGGPSKGWYFSEKLLNFIRAEELVNLRRNGCLDLIANDKNVFSDAVLNKAYAWNTHKPDIHKNYLLSISKTLKNLTKKSIPQRIDVLLELIDNARLLYGKLETLHSVYLYDESGDYHLSTWAAFLRSHLSR